jgi:hypothetical protein
MCQQQPEQFCQHWNHQSSRLSQGPRGWKMSENEAKQKETKTEEGKIQAFQDNSPESTLSTQRSPLIVWNASIGVLSMPFIRNFLLYSSPFLAHFMNNPPRVTVTKRKFDAFWL